MESQHVYMYSIHRGLDSAPQLWVSLLKFCYDIDAVMNVEVTFVSHEIFLFHWLI